MQRTKSGHSTVHERLQPTKTVIPRRLRKVTMLPSQLPAEMAPYSRLLKSPDIDTIAGYCCQVHSSQSIEKEYIKTREVCV